MHLRVGGFFDAVTDASGRILLVNRAFTKVFGYTQEDVKFLLAPMGMAVSINVITGMPSEDVFQVMRALLGRSLLALRPVTGRSHQLRVHLSWQGWPILGDALYAPPAIAQTGSRLALHAWRLGIEHPISGDNRLWECPCPAGLGSEFCQQTVALGLHNMSIPIQPGDCNA